ncbi:hypothetical protein P2P98_13145 [Microbacterium sp. Kw_RZR3]|uniref:hypothetical protein n=1 Tax=Microbacterium sp. Kw_RZR3 TaxID=3032903 RepID=UPI0023DAC2F5|nr:hypothetical protein [Microbacterium sp. Kw_RZR3]MDF2047107.1 hypothetical protein [Microbacterium sp. Kw_RZR3]
MTAPTAATVLRLCEYWIGSDSKGRMCRAEVTSIYRFCDKHLPIERARAEKRLAKTKASNARAEAAWRARNVPRLPQMRAQLERVEAEYARRTRSTVDDRAAVGGNTHRSIDRARLASLSDSNVSRVVELQRMIAALKVDIARAEKPEVAS